jgi:hypothetical protein
VNGCRQGRKRKTRAATRDILHKQSGAMAQLVARLVRNEKVRGSNPLSSTKSAKKGRLTRMLSGQAAFLVWCESSSQPIDLVAHPETTSNNRCYRGPGAHTEQVQASTPTPVGRTVAAPEFVDVIEFVDPMAVIATPQEGTAFTMHLRGGRHALTTFLLIGHIYRPAVAIHLDASRPALRKTRRSAGN